MCLAVPLRAIKRQKNYWLMEDKRLVKGLIKMKTGDYYLCQQDLAIEKVSPNKAKLIRHALRVGI